MNHRRSIDLHQDILLHHRRRDLYKDQEFQTSFDDLQKNNVKIVVASGFALPENNNVFDQSVPDLLEKDFEMYHHWCLEHPLWSIVTNASEVFSVLHNSSRHGIVLHVEGLNVPQSFNWERFEQWYQEGWRSVGIVWNHSNIFGGGAGDSISSLTSQGRNFLLWANERHMVVDFAHMNRRTFWEAASVIKGPIVVSHGNADALCSHERNYSDEQLQVVAASGGIVGVFLSNKFLHSSGAATIDDVVRHIDHLCEIMGPECVALGSDFGGITSGTPRGLASIAQLYDLWEALQQHGYSEEVIEGIAHRNAERVLQTILQ